MRLKDPQPKRSPRNSIGCWWEATDETLEGISPFRGLVPFEEEHSALYFGREVEITSFVERLRHEPLIPIVGPSGAGKSSFVKAGVIPRLREKGPLILLQIRPGRDPFRALASRLVQAVQPTHRLHGWFLICQHLNRLAHQHMIP